MASNTEEITIEIHGIKIPLSQVEMIEHPPRGMSAWCHCVAWSKPAMYLA